MIVLCRRFAALPASGMVTKTWTDRFVVAEFFGGLAWAAALLLVPHATTGLAGLGVFRFATALIVVSVIASLASTLPLAAVAGTVPVTLTLVGVYLARDEPVFMLLSLMVLGAQIFFLLLSSRLRSATVTMLEYRAEKDLLIAELGAEKSMSDESRRRAEEANLAKSRFLATMSHELRNAA
jgi:two-component system cell cycle sensor histidine kinase PleC